MNTTTQLTGIVGNLSIAVLAIGFALDRLCPCDQKTPIAETDVESIYSGEVDGRVQLTIGETLYTFAPNVARAIGADLIAGAEEIEAE